MWTTNSDSTVTKYGSNGAVLSPPGGYPTSGGALSIDPAGNLWITASGTNNNCYMELNHGGQIITPSTNYCAKAGGGMMFEDATDGSGNAWFYSTTSISKVSGTGVYLNSGVDTNGCFYFDPAAQTPPQNGFNVAAENLTTGLIYDRVLNQLWGIALTGLGALRADGTQVFCDINGSHLPVTPGYETHDGHNGGATGFLWDVGGTTDGAGNLWLVTWGYQILVVGGVQITQTTYSGLNEVDPSGKLLTPFDAGKNILGLQALSGKTPSGLAVDAYGNIWTVIPQSVTLVKVSGLATPKNYQ